MFALAEATELLKGTLRSLVRPSAAPAFLVGPYPFSDLGFVQLLNG